MLTQQHADTLINKICYFLQENKKKEERAKLPDWDWTLPTKEEIVEEFSLTSHEFYSALLELIREEHNRVIDARMHFKAGENTKAWHDMNSNEQVLANVKSILSLGDSLLPMEENKCPLCKGVGFVFERDSARLIPCKQCSTPSVSRV